MAAAHEIRRVLIADDELTLRDFFQEALTLEGFTVETCGDSYTTIARIAAFQPAIIMLDSELHPTGGFPILERLRERGNLAPIIFMATEHDKKLKKICDEWPHVHYLAKPFGFQELLQVLARA